MPTFGTGVGTGTISNAQFIGSHPDVPTNQIVTPGNPDVIDVAATLSATASLGATAVREQPATATLSATASLGATAVREQPATATLSETHSLGATSEVVKVGTAALSATHVLVGAAVTNTKFLFSDNFNRPDETRLDTSLWDTTPAAGTVSIGVSSNQAYTALPGSNSIARYKQLPNDQTKMFSEITVFPEAGVNAVLAPAVMMPPLGTTYTAGTNSYYLLWANGATQTSLRIYRRDAGTNVVTLLGAAVAIPGGLQPGDRLRLEYDGTDLIGYINGVEFIRRASSLVPLTEVSSSYGVGFQFGASANARMDDWAGGDFFQIAQVVAALSATHTLSSTPVRTQPAAATLSATATLGATPVREQPAAATLSATHSLASTAVREVPSTVTLSATHTLTSAAVREQLATAILAGIHSLSAVAVREQLAAVALSGIHSLSAVVVRVQPATATLSAIHTLSGTAVRGQLGTAVLTAVHTLISSLISLSDNFNRADGPLGPNWTTHSVTGASIVSNQFTTVGVTGAQSRHVTELSSDDMFAEVKFIAWASGTAGPAVRMPVLGTANGTTHDYYVLTVNSLLDLSIRRKNDLATSTFQMTPSGSLGTVASGDVIRLEARGTTLTAYINGVMVGQVDTSVAPLVGGVPAKGVGLYAGGASGNTFDDWAAGELPSPLVTKLGTAVLTGIHILAGAAVSSTKLLFKDNFNRADEARLNTSLWDTTPSGSGFLAVANNQVINGGTGNALGRYKGLPNDQTKMFAELTWATVNPGVSMTIGPAVMIPPLGATYNTTDSFYYLAAPGAAQNSLRIVQRLAQSNAGVVLGTTVAISPGIQPGDVLRLEYDGTDLIGSVNGVEKIRRASSILPLTEARASNGVGIISGPGIGSGDDWSGGDLFQVAQGDATLSATHTLAGVGIDTAVSAATLTATHTLSGAGEVVKVATAALSAIHTLSATGVVTPPTGALASLNATHTLSGTGFMIRPTTATFSGTHTLSLTGVVTRPSTATFSATHSLSAAATRAVIGAANLTAIHTLAGSAQVIKVSDISLSAIHLLAASPVLTRLSTATLTATHQLAATGEVSIQLTATLLGIHTLSGEARGEYIAPRLNNVTVHIGPPRTKWAATAPNGRWGASTSTRWGVQVEAVPWQTQPAGSRWAVKERR